MNVRSADLGTSSAINMHLNNTERKYKTALMNETYSKSYFMISVLQ